MSHLPTPGLPGRRGVEEVKNPFLPKGGGRSGERGGGGGEGGPRGEDMIPRCRGGPDRRRSRRVPPSRDVARARGQS